LEDLREGELGTIILIGEMEEEMTPLLGDEEAPATEKLENRMGKAASQWVWAAIMNGSELPKCE
jgi:hypothetical protein